ASDTFVRYRVTVMRAVRGVAVDKNGGIPFVEAADQTPDLRTLQLDEISIQIQTLTIETDTDAAGRADLCSAMGLVDLFIAVGVKDRRDQQDEILEQRPLPLTPPCPPGGEGEGGGG